MNKRKIILILWLISLSPQIFTNNDRKFYLLLQAAKYKSIKDFFTRLNIPIVNINLGLDIEPTIFPHQKVMIVDFGEKYVIVIASKLLGFKHCLYKAIEYFNSKYSKFFLRVTDLYKNQSLIIVRFVAYNTVS